MLYCQDQARKFILKLQSYTESCALLLLPSVAWGKVSLVIWRCDYLLSQRSLLEVSTLDEQYDIMQGVWQWGSEVIQYISVEHLWMLSLFLIEDMSRLETKFRCLKPIVHTSLLCAFSWNPTNCSALRTTLSQSLRTKLILQHLDRQTMVGSSKHWKVESQIPCPISRTWTFTSVSDSYLGSCNNIMIIDEETTRLPCLVQKSRRIRQ